MEQILQNHPDLEKEDILQALQYAVLISEDQYIEISP